jgi:hypothetical protein
LLPISARIANHPDATTLSPIAPSARRCAHRFGKVFLIGTHTHFSVEGTPRVHAFNTEPAFFDRGLFFDAVWTGTDEGVEYELATEMEWALTRRIGVVLEVPAAVLNPRTATRNRGSATS